ncbi:MAG: MopE-related protein [Myxococcota bacterium]|nr:MopE-related protein [Myxococcota bacterium]
MRPLLTTAALGLFSCAPDHEITAQRRELSTELATFDAGAVAVGDRETLPIYLRSTAQGPVTILDIYSDDEEHFAILDSWKTEDTDGDGVPDAQIIDGGSLDIPTYGLVEINFRPDGEEYFRTTLTIVSNDSEVYERDEDGNGLWRVVLRGIGRNPCANIYPLFHDFGNRTAGGYFSSDVTVENCGSVTLTISDFDAIGSTSFYVPDHLPIYVLPKTRNAFKVAWIPASSNAEDAIVEIGINDPTYDEVITAIGNDCENSVDPTWDDDADGWFACGGDCNDYDGSINPSALENANNGEDDDCDGQIDEASSSLSQDDDDDGWSENDGDCDDNDASVFPDAIEYVNQIDDNCDGRIDDTTDWFDDDADGFSEREGDCNDDNPLIHPGAEETANKTDDDCDGSLDEGSFTYDDDGDSYPEYIDGVYTDCSDDDPWSFPGALEDCDGADNDCDGLIDEDENDIAEGACAFIVERSTTVSTQEGCATVRPTSGVALLSLLALLGTALRRRRQR